MFPGHAEKQLKLTRTNDTGPVQMEFLVKKYVAASEERLDGYNESRRKEQMPSPSPTLKPPSVPPVID